MESLNINTEYAWLDVFGFKNQLDKEQYQQ